MGKLTSFLRKRRSKNCITVKIIPLPRSTLNFLRKHGTEIFFLVMRISSVPNLYLGLLHLGHFGIESDCPCRCISNFLSVERYFCMASLFSVHFDQLY